MAVHNGHVALINFAASQCDEVIVSMSHTDSDPIDPALRFFWIKEIFKNNSSIKPEMVKDDFDDESLPLAERTAIWATFIKARFLPIDFLFSSEEYGDPFAGHLGIPHIIFDQQRIKIPVSATVIRKRPFANWDYIPEIVRPYFVKKICFYGPESTGKSTLAKYFASLFETAFVPEVARELLTSNSFSVEDIINIGEAQTARVLDKVKTANKFLFCDTDLITTEIYSQHYLHAIPEILFDLEKRITYDQYFLMDIDVPWEADGLRDLGDKRADMFDVFKTALDERGLTYCLVRGSRDERIQIVMQVLKKLSD